MILYDENHRILYDENDRDEFLQRFDFVQKDNLKLSKALGPAYMVAYLHEQNVSRPLYLQDALTLFKNTVEDICQEFLKVLSDCYTDLEVTWDKDRLDWARAKLSFQVKSLKETMIATDVSSVSFSNYFSILSDLSLILKELSEKKEDKVVILLPTYTDLDKYLFDSTDSLAYVCRLLEDAIKAYENSPEWRKP